MKVQKINFSSITDSDIKLYKEKISELDGVVFNASDVNIDKRIITLRLGNKEDELTLVNPKVLQFSDSPLVYFEKDTHKENKVRKTIRVPWIVLDTDNLGKVEFKAQKTDWKNADEFFGDIGLLEQYWFNELLMQLTVLILHTHLANIQKLLEKIKSQVEMKELCCKDQMVKWNL